MDLGERADRFRFPIRDRDIKFTAVLDDVIAGSGARIIKTPVRSPWANSFAEWYAGTLRRECFDHPLIHGEQHPPEVVDREVEAGMTWTVEEGSGALWPDLLASRLA